MDGGMIYCIYKTIKDDNGNVVSAIVVGRYITDLKKQVNKPIRDMELMMTVVLIIFSLLVLAVVI